MGYRIYLTAPEIVQTAVPPAPYAYRIMVKYRITTENGVAKENGTVVKNYIEGASTDDLKTEFTVEFNKIIKNFLALESIKADDRLPKMMKNIEEKMDEKLNPISTVKSVLRNQ